MTHQAEIRTTHLNLATYSEGRARSLEVLASLAAFDPHRSSWPAPRCEWNYRREMGLVGLGAPHGVGIASLGGSRGSSRSRPFYAPRKGLPKRRDSVRPSGWLGEVTFGPSSKGIGKAAEDGETLQQRASQSL